MAGNSRSCSGSLRFVPLFLSAVGRPLESRTPAPLPEFVGLREDFEDTEIITFWRSFRRISNSKQPFHEKVGSISYMYEAVFPATFAIKTKARK